MTLTLGQRVLYVPRHAYGDVTHPDCEQGVLVGTKQGVLFVRFYNQHPGADAKACSLELLVGLQDPP